MPSPDRENRPRNAGEVARTVGELRSESEQCARQAELDRVRGEVLAVEHRKRRRVKTALAASVLVLLVGIGAAGWWNDRQASSARRTQSVDSRKTNSGQSAARMASAGMRKPWRQRSNRSRPPCATMTP